MSISMDPNICLDTNKWEKDALSSDVYAIQYYNINGSKQFLHL